MMKTSKRGLVEIANHEGIVVNRYKDSVGVWTIGIGHTKAAGDPNPAKITGELSIPEIMDIFANDIKAVERRVNAAFKRPLTQEQFDAAVSFDFNTGGIFRATWVSYFNDGRSLKDVGNAFMNWSKPKEIIPRRTKEKNLFVKGQYSSGGAAPVIRASAAGTPIYSKAKSVNILALLAEPVADETPKAANVKAEKAQRAPEPKVVTEPKQSLADLINSIIAAMASAFKRTGEKK